MSRNPKLSHKPSKEIPVTNIGNRSTKVLFSFEYLDTKNSKYSMSNITDNRLCIRFYNDFYKKISDYSKYDNFRKMINDDGRYRDRNHIHPIDWGDSKIRESCFTILDKKLMEQVKNDCWQLGINSTTFRIHGFFIGNVFYIVWLDPLHQLYASK